MPLLLAVNALGTRVELAIDGAQTPALRAVGERAIDTVLEWHERLSHFLPHSFLSHMNRTAATRPVALDEDMFTLMALCERVHRDSGGAFDPTVGGLMAARGLHPGAGASPETGWSALVELDEGSCAIRFKRAGVRLDLGGVAKGFVLDKAAAALREHGAGSALIHAGASGVVAVGQTPRVIGVRRAGGVDTLTIRDEALCVSAPRGRATGRCTHIMDPACAQPAQRVDTALVVGPSCAEADAWATALVAMGERQHRLPPGLRAGVHDTHGWTTSRIRLTRTANAATEAA